MSTVIDHDRADMWTLDQVRVVLGSNYDDFARDLAAGAVPSTLAVMTAGAMRPIAVTAGAVSDWLHGRIPAAVFPRVEVGTPERVLQCLRTDVARWAYQDRIDAGVAADLEHYLQRITDVLGSAS